MELLYMGHAGILAKERDVMVAIDPFLSGSFLWNGKLNVYKGDSPWIGSQERMQSFIDAFGKEINAIAITHAHKDHFDPEAIALLIKSNPEIEFYAPYPVINWLRASSMFDPATSKFAAPVRWNESFEIEGETGSLDLVVLPGPGSRQFSLPSKVGYFIGNPGGTGVALPGDAHGAGSWDHCKERTRSVVIWGVKERDEIVAYFAGGNQLETVWWIHWEEFTPGNFSCSMDPREFMKEHENKGYKTSLLDYTKWMVC
ncbi:MAG: MBL fold metallo-hydrolase [Promethearchaeota archaeon]